MSNMKTKVGWGTRSRRSPVRVQTGSFGCWRIEIHWKSNSSPVIVWYPYVKFRYAPEAVVIHGKGQIDYDSCITSASEGDWLCLHLRKYFQDYFIVGAKLVHNRPQ
jgi:hypothetical protein